MALSGYTGGGLLKKNPLLGSAWPSAAAQDASVAAQLGTFRNLHQRAVASGGLSREAFAESVRPEYDEFVEPLQDKAQAAYDEWARVRDWKERRRKKIKARGNWSKQRRRRLNRRFDPKMEAESDRYDDYSKTLGERAAAYNTFFGTDKFASSFDIDRGDE